LTNRNFLIFILKNFDWLIFFFKLKPKIFWVFFLFVGKRFGVAKVGLGELFCLRGAILGACGLVCGCFRIYGNKIWCLPFPLRCLRFFCTFVNTNSGLVFVAVFCSGFFAVLFCRFFALFALLPLA